MLTTTQISQLSWAKVGIVPVIIQHNVSGEVLMHGYMNEDALKKTLLERRITFFSRTKNRLWTKGETSGYFLNLVSITTDCDNDALLATVNPIGPTCHLKKSSCFFPVVTDVAFLYQFETLLAERKNANPMTSYTAKLYASGTKRIAQKVGEEGVETALAAVDNNRCELINELSDLFYHMLVLMQDQNIKLSDIVSNLRIRNKSR